MNDQLCLACRKPIPSYRNRNAKYCCTDCKIALFVKTHPKPQYRRKRKRAA